VKTLPREIFTRIDQLDAPRLVEYWEQDPCLQANAPIRGRRHKFEGAPAAPRAAEAKSKDLGVTIEAQFTVGEYDIVVLGAKDSSGLDTWLRHEGYKIPEGSEPFLRPYVANGSKFFVAKVDVSKVKMDDAGNAGDGKKTATLSPLRFHYDAPDLALPVRLGLVSSAGTQDLVVHVLGKGKRYEVANYPNVTIPTNLDVAESAKGAFGSFYAALFDRTVAKTPRAVVTEYAWDAGSCDPCPAPPLTDAELVTLGADVLPSVSSESDLMERDLLKALGADAGPSLPSRTPPASGPVPRRRYYGVRSFVLTRLHARYTREAIGEDLVFREAPPLVGGREIRRADGTLETVAAVTPDARYATNGFQGRYAVRHGWTGPISCVAPVRNVWGGPPNGLDNGGAKPALGLAYAPRGKVQLASFLRSDVAALDLVAAGPPPSGVGTFTAPGALAPPDVVGLAVDGGAADGGSGGAAGGGAGQRSGCGGCSSASASHERVDGGWLLAGLAALAVVARRGARRASRR
jgi:MYXO-CTERM domain-containing protein